VKSIAQLLENEANAGDVGLTGFAVAITRFAGPFAYKIEVRQMHAGRKNSQISVLT